MRVPDKSFPIVLHHRPRRVAFLVDMNQESMDKILRGILHFNLDSWGGRHNPIVPLINKRVSESYYPLLDVVDPDIFYIYGEIDSPGLEEIHYRFSPTYVTRHVVREPIDSHSYAVRLQEQATIGKSLRNLRDKLPLFSRRSEPCVLQLEIAEGRSLSPFFLWNFGYTEANFFAIQNYGVPGCKPNSTSDHDLLELLARQMNLVWPIHVCGDAPLARTAGDSWRYYIPIFYGVSPWNLLAYWNDGLTSGPTPAVHGGINQLWLTPEAMEDAATYKQLVRLFQLRVYSGNHQKGLKIISYDTEEKELEGLGKKLVEDIRGTLHYEGSAKFDPPHIDAFEPQRVISFIPAREEIEYATGKDIHLALRRPPDVAEDTDQCWMVDARIYNPDQELWYGNAAPWWRLPRKSSIAGLFHRSRPQRIIFDNRASFEVGAREASLDFEVPSNGNLFRHLLSPEIHYHLAADLRSTLKRHRPYEIRLSDKGRYLSGIRNLFNTLRETLYFFEHHFWRSLLQTLSQREPSKQLTQKLTSNVQKLLRNAWSMEAGALEARLTHEVIFASKGLSRARAWLTFSAIQDLYEAYVQGLGEEEKQFCGKDLKSDLSELTRDNVMFQGVEVRCPNCISSYWYSVEEMRKTVTCRGCHVSFSLPAETQWSYQLNELVRVGVGDQGLSPVLRTLARLFNDVRDCFFFTPSADFLVYPDEGEPRVEHELDLAWIKDGMFGIAEVKSTTDLFKGSDYQDMAAIAQSIKPDVVLIAAPEGKDDDIVKGKKALEEKLGAKFEVWAWGPEEFRKSPFWTRL